MALFKIEKGLAANLSLKRPNAVEGYCYVTTDDGKFYIDTGTGSASSNRIVLNAGTADKLAKAVTIAIDGDITGSAQFDGSQDVTINVDASKLNDAISSLKMSASNGVKIVNNDIQHTNAVAAGTAKEGGSSRTLAFGGTFKVPSVTYDSQGHITNTGSVTLTMPANPNTNTTYQISGELDSSENFVVSLTPSTGTGSTATVPVMTGASSSAAGTTGLVPGAAAGSQAQFLRGDGTWATPKNTTYSAATTTKAGLMSAGDKTKLDGIAAGAEVNQNAFSNIVVGSTTLAADSATDTVTLVAGTNVTLTADGDTDSVTITAKDTTYSNFVKSGSGAKAGLVPAPSTTAGTSKYLREDGTWVKPPNSNTTYSMSGALTDNNTYTVTLDPSSGDNQTAVIPAMVGASSSTAGAAGLVPGADAGNQGKFLRGDGTWGIPTNTTYSNATTSTAGLMSAADKEKLDGIAAQANKYTLPNAGTSLGGVKSGGVATISNGQITAISEAGKVSNALTFGSKTYNGSAAQEITAADLGLSLAMKFIGTTTTAIADGNTTKTIVIGGKNVTAENGNVVIYGAKEFIWNGSAWEEFGNEGNYKVKQTAKTDPTASGNATSFIATISQDAEGVITATKSTIPTASSTTSGLMTAAMVSKLSGITDSADSVSISRSVTSGTKIGTITINGSGTDLYAPENTDRAVESVSYHYTPTADSSKAINVDASSTTKASWGSTSLVTGVNLQRDAAGHVTGMTVDSIQMPSNPNSNTTYTLSGKIADDDSSYVTTLTPSSGTATTATIPLMTAASDSAAGAPGLVPAPGAGENDEFLRGDGTWAVPTNTNTKMYVYRQTSGYDNNYPLLVSRSLASSIGTADTDNSKTGVYAVFREDANNNATLLANPAKGTITAPGGFIGTADAAKEVPWSGVTSKPSYYDGKAITSISRSGTTFTATYLDGTTTTFTQQDNNTTYSVVTASSNGLVPKFDAADGTIDSSSSDWVLTNNNGSIGWYKLPANAFKNDNTTYTFTNKDATLSWGTESTLATVGGTDITVTMPKNPTKQVFDVETSRFKEGLVCYKPDGTTVHQYIGFWNVEGIIINPAYNADGNTANMWVKDEGLLVTPTALKFNGTEVLMSNSTNYIKSLSISGKTITYTKGDGTTGTLTTQDNNTTYSAGTGLSLSGTTFNHSNSITAKTSYNQSTNSPGYGGKFKITEPKYDAQGHITGVQVAEITMPSAQTIPTTLKSPYALKIGNISYDGSAEKTVSAADLGITGAMVYKGTSSVEIKDGGTQAPTIGGTSIATSNLQAGNVVLYSGKEFVWNGSAWELLGDEGSYKVKQDAVSDPTASGTSKTFIATISQDANGKITATKKTVSTMTGASSSAAGATGLVPAPAAGNQGKFLRGDGTWATAYTHPTTTGNKHIPSGGSSGQILRWSSDGTATWGADNDTNYYHTRKYNSGLQISTGTGVDNMYVPEGTTNTLGVVKQHSSTDCTTYTSDAGATTPAAVKQAVQKFINAGSNITLTWNDDSSSDSYGYTITSSYTNTKNTAGSTDSSSKLFLIGATSQAANPQTYSHDTAYVGTDGCLYSNSKKVSVAGHTHTIDAVKASVSGEVLVLTAVTATGGA